ncbi:hypothetical protein QQF64_031622, partial [Cirrhinus molitorella]
MYRPLRWLLKAVLTNGSEESNAASANVTNIENLTRTAGSVEMHLFYTSLVLCVLSACHMTISTCDELLTLEDAEFCKGELKVIYPDLVVDKCVIVPQSIREKISKEWGPPRVQLPSADEVRKIH